MSEMTGPEEAPAALRARIHGRVQGVGFRWFVQERGRQLGLSGFVRNREDGTVETEAHGSRPALETFLGALRHGPPGANVTEVDVWWAQVKTGLSSEFEIRP